MCDTIYDYRRYLQFIKFCQVRDKLLENKVRAPARPGAIAPLSVVIPAHNTGLSPEKTSFFQALSIPTKISKGKNRKTI